MVCTVSDWPSIKLSLESREAVKLGQLPSLKRCGTCLQENNHLLLLNGRCAQLFQLLFLPFLSGDRGFDKNKVGDGPCEKQHNLVGC